ncbi:SNARE associated Golgi protein [Thiorhodovibrio winogradskyi]|uniref:SNARE associated Golgi protein n=1 Tax=Thiorhodovibrio winogradskyi TaxID=77007 RepID=A0ABZ0S7L3_9GAMM|nr:YqaA family protein [Thiorhodovibrio winogradskyi]
MRLFSALYARVMRWSEHRHAPWYLGALSFSESSFFPIPPDVMLAPMCLTRPQRAWWFAGLTTLTSVAGGLLGYLIGRLAFDLVEPIVGPGGHYSEAFGQAQDWFQHWGIWAVFLAGFSPIPYKIFTITAGVVGMALIPFAIASAIGRGLRFFMVAALMVWGGAPMEAHLRRYVDLLGWLLVLAIGLLVLIKTVF